MNRVAPPAVTTNFETLAWRPDAKRLESGNLNYAGALSLPEGVGLINELGVSQIEEEVLRLEKLLRKRLLGLPLTVVQPKDPRNWSGLVCVYYPPQAEEAVAAILGRRKIYTTMRGGYIRLAIDFYNTEEQVENAAKALWEIAALSH